MKTPLQMVFCDPGGTLYDHPDRYAAFRSGRKIIYADLSECIPLPFGSEIFSMPGRTPIGYKSKGKDAVEISNAFGIKCDTAAAFLPSGYLRTYLPAYSVRLNAQTLPLWAYAGIGMHEDSMYAPGFRIDEDPRSDPQIHENDGELAESVKEFKSRYAKNRLIGQLAKCSIEYRCLCARNFFLGRYEAPIPTTPVCNARCIGCLSFQDKDVSGFTESQNRLDFAPDPSEIAEVILEHFKNVPNGIASFGQGCEGEPLLRGAALAEAIKIVRAKTSNGTIHLNTNGSLPEMLVKMIDAGLDSVRVSMNSPTADYYNLYYKPVGYSFPDIVSSVDIARNRGLFVSINLFFIPGFTDAESEVESLYEFLRQHPVQMIQTRNLNVDPDYYFTTVGLPDSKGVGVRSLVLQLEKDFPQMRLGYYNPSKERFDSTSVEKHNRLR